MSSRFIPIQIPPGVVATGTKNMSSSNWAECNMVRWREGQLTPMGGQAQFSNIVSGTETYVFASRCKRIHQWYGLDQVSRIAYLCETNIYVDEGGVLTDITPVSGLTPIGYGDGAYSADGYSGDPTYGLTPPSPLGVGGYSDGPYSAGAYGTARSESTIAMIDQLPAAYSLDNFGSILYAMTSADGRLLMWDPAVGGRAVVQPPATGRGPVPSGRCFVVAPERFIMIFGSTADGTTGGGGPRRFAWCDQENPGAWDYSNVTSQAGFLDIEPASPIITTDATRVGVIFWTAKKAYVSRFLGLPYVYNYSELADGTCPWSPQSVTTTSSMTLWMSEQGVFSFDGTSILPVQCMVRPWIDEDIDQVAVRNLSFAAHLGQFSEWWWFFPSLNSTFNTKAIVYNYKEGWWTQVRMSRSAGITSSYVSHPIFADDFVAFQHEVGTVYANAAANAPVSSPFAETFDLNVAAGGRLVTVKQLLPDIQTVNADPTQIQSIISSLGYSLFYRNSRSLGDPEKQTASASLRSNGYVDFRTTGRDIRLRLDVVGTVVQPFTLGQHQIDIVVRGDR